MRLILDTNVLVSDFHLRSGAFEIILRDAGKDFRLVVPEIVVLEAVNKLGEKAIEVLPSLDTSAGKLRPYLPDLVPSMPSVLDVEDACREYELWLRKRLDEVHAEVPDMTAAEHEFLVIRALERRKPFRGSDETGDGYRDALLWENVIEVARGDSVAFISANSTDFAAAEGDYRLHDDLVTDLKERGIDPSRVRLYRDLQEYVAVNVTPAEEGLKEVRRLLVEDVAYRQSFSEAVMEALRSELPEGSELDEQLLEKGPETIMVYYLDGDTLQDIDVSDTHALDGDRLLLEAGVTLDVTIDGYSHKSEVEFIEDRGWEVWEADWNNHYSWVAKTMPMTAYLEVRCNQADKAVTAVAILSFEFQEE